VSTFLNIGEQHAQHGGGQGSLRERQWIYLGPIIAAPLAHIAVTSYRYAKTPLQRRFVIGVGVAGTTAFSFVMRLVLMDHAGKLFIQFLYVSCSLEKKIRNSFIGKITAEFLAGYAGGATPAVTVNERTIGVQSDDERIAVLDPSSSTILRGAFRGFG